MGAIAKYCSRTESRIQKSGVAGQRATNISESIWTGLTGFTEIFHRVPRRDAIPLCGAGVTPPRFFRTRPAIITGVRSPRLRRNSLSPSWSRWCWGCPCFDHPEFPQSGRLAPRGDFCPVQDLPRICRGTECPSHIESVPFHHLFNLMIPTVQRVPRVTPQRGGE